MDTRISGTLVETHACNSPALTGAEFESEFDSTRVSRSGIVRYCTGAPYRARAGRLGLGKNRIAQDERGIKGNSSKRGIVHGWFQCSGLSDIDIERDCPEVAGDCDHPSLAKHSPCQTRTGNA